MRLELPGLLPTPYDERDFQLGAITTLPPLSELPHIFILPNIEIKNQRNSDFCSQFMSCGMNGLEEGTSLSPEWAFAVSKQLSGDPDAFGQDLRTALSVHVKYGAIEAKDCPYTVDNKDTAFLRRITNYPSLFVKATEHIKKSYVKVTGNFDAFDNIRSTIWKYRAEKRGVGTGFIFGWDTDDKILDTIPRSGGGHAMYYAGWTTIKNIPYLVVVNSYGKEAGDQGTHLVSREVANYFEAIYGAYMFIDMDPATVRYMQEHGITDRDSWLTALMKRAVSLLTDLRDLLKKKMN